MNTTSLNATIDNYEVKSYPCEDKPCFGRKLRSIARHEATCAPTVNYVYPIEQIRADVRQWLAKGLISRYQFLDSLCSFIPAREWQAFEGELALNDYLLRDRIIDLIPQETWLND